MTKTCLFCAYWKPEGKIRKIVRHGGKCILSDEDTRQDHSYWGWKICSPNQLDQRKEAGLIEEVEA